MTTFTASLARPHDPEFGVDDYTIPLVPDDLREALDTALSFERALGVERVRDAPHYDLVEHAGQNGQVSTKQVIRAYRLTNRLRVPLNEAVTPAVLLGWLDQSNDPTTLPAEHLQDLLRRLAASWETRRLEIAYERTPSDIIGRLIFRVRWLGESRAEMGTLRAMWVLQELGVDQGTEVRDGTGTRIIGSAEPQTLINAIDAWRNRHAGVKDKPVSLYEIDRHLRERYPVTELRVIEHADLAAIDSVRSVARWARERDAPLVRWA